MFVSIRWKVIALIVGVVVLVTGLDAYRVPQSAAESAHAALEGRADSVAAMLADSVAPALDFGQLDAAQTALEVSRADALVLWAAAYDQRGNRLAASGKGSPSTLPRESKGTSRILATAPIAEHGTVAVSLDAAGVQRQREESARDIAMQGLVIGAFGVFIAFLFGSRMGRTLSEMSQVAQDIARGNISRTYEFRASNDELGRMAEAFAEMAQRLRGLMENARRVSEGDLTVSVSDDGELYAVFGDMVRNLRELANQVSTTSDAVAGAAAGLFSAVRQQEAISTQQNSALEEIRLTLESLTSSAEQVSADAGQVRTMADSSLESSQRIAEHTRLVSTHSERIGEILQLIQDIADKSDLLALNAALEGTNAGEVGRGFSLVAAEMRRLSEHVMDSVRDIRKLVADTREASHASVLATEEGIKLSRETAGSAAKISEAVSRQREGTQQVRDSADEIVRVVSESMASSADTTRAGESLLQLSQQLKTAAQKFRVSSNG